MKDSIVGTIALIHMAIDEKVHPTNRAKGIIKIESGSLISWNNANTSKIIDELIMLFVEPHKISPKIISSRFKGVLIIASKVF